MNTRKNLWPLFVLIILSGCGQVTIKNSEWCGDIGEFGASCFNTLSNQSREIPKEQWDQERFGQVCTQAKSFSDLKTSLEKLCFISKKCTYQQKKTIKELGIKIESFIKEKNAVNP